jgi:hypothetical protein
MIAANPTRERAVALTPKGACAVAGIRLREAIGALPELEQRRLLCELDQLVARYAAAEAVR